MLEGKKSGQFLMPTLPSATPLDELVLFGFDDRAFPFQGNVQAHLIPGRRPRFVLEHGPEGSHDEVLLYYGTVILIDDTFHMWYNGNYGPTTYGHMCYERVNCVICYATSKDGVNWEKPELGLVEFNGSKKNNIVDLPAPDLWSTCAVLYEPEDSDPNRRFKMVYETTSRGGENVAFSPDGLRWTIKEKVMPGLEMTGLIKFRGVYYVNGQGGSQRPVPGRRLVTYASTDFERWSPCGAVGLERTHDLSGPSTAADAHQYEEIHLGAGLWNRGNVLIGFYGQWHGHFSGDRRRLTLDIGMAVSHDAVHFHEPIPDFRIIPAREQPGSPWDVGPALMQGQGMENFGDQTLYWYSLWRGTAGSGIRLVTWERDRIGMLKPFRSSGAQAVSCPIKVVDGQGKVYVNASGLGEYSQLRIGLVDEGFNPIPGYSGEDVAVIAKSGLRIPVQWKGGDSLLPSQGLVRLDIQFTGIRPEDCQLFAMYVGE